MTAKETRAFFAYPAAPKAIAETIVAAAGLLNGRGGPVAVTTWPEMDIAGRFVGTEVLSRIQQADVLVADVTRLNFNVTFEVGFAIGCGKPIVLVRNEAYAKDRASWSALGIYDTLGHLTYATAERLHEILKESVLSAVALSTAHTQDRRTPVFVVAPRHKTDADMRVFARLKKTRLRYRSHDPEEHGRLAAPRAIEDVARSFGVVVHFIEEDRADSQLHNLRSAFVFGLARGMEKVTVALQRGEFPVPLDYRDLTASYESLSSINEHVGEFAAEVTERFQGGSARRGGREPGLLARISLGASAAENEMQEISEYYLPTQHYERVRRGEINVVAGRKGAGKTALFVALRGWLWQHGNFVVLDLRPEGYQFLKFKEVALDLLRSGTREHTLTAFWEYLLLLEICHRLLALDRRRHVSDHRLYGPYKQLMASFGSDEWIGEADFAERTSRLLSRLSDEITLRRGATSEPTTLTGGELTQMLYCHDVGSLQKQVRDYLTFRGELWVLVDNIDKGWPAHGVTEDDAIIVRCLLDALEKLRRTFERAKLSCRTVLFIRNDVYELVVASTPDRGKVSRVVLDWTDSDLLREVLRRRLAWNSEVGDVDFDTAWRTLFISHVNGEESSQFLLDRCLMRPRALIDLVQACLGHAASLRKDRVDADDIRAGLEMFSSDLVVGVGHEIADVESSGGSVMYAFLGCGSRVVPSEVHSLLRSEGVPDERLTAVIRILLWHGVLGVVVGDGAAKYIYDVSYDERMLAAIEARAASDSVRYEVNRAFWSALAIVPGDV